MNFWKTFLSIFKYTFGITPEPEPEHEPIERRFDIVARYDSPANFTNYSLGMACPNQHVTVLWSVTTVEPSVRAACYECGEVAKPAVIKQDVTNIGGKSSTSLSFHKYITPTRKKKTDAKKQKN